jgi:hypothetical protein
MFPAILGVARNSCKGVDVFQPQPIIKAMPDKQLDELQGHGFNGK